MQISFENELKLVVSPSPILRRIAKKVVTVNHAILSLANKMFDIMYNSNGIGLAAPQVGVSKRVIIIDIDGSNPLVMINPTIQKKSTKLIISQEGCLSVPNKQVEVSRAKTVDVSFLDCSNNTNLIRADDLLSCCIQHEIDHLNGVLLIDYMKDSNS